MALCLADSLASGGVDYADIMDRFCRWRDGGEYTPHGYAFDIGGATGRALCRFCERARRRCSAAAVPSATTATAR